MNLLENGLNTLNARKNTITHNNDSDSEGEIIRPN
jgi:hypothetical protein